MEIGIVLLVIAAITVLFYLLGRRNGKKVGVREFLDKICQPYRETQKIVIGMDGSIYVYDVTTKFSHQKIIIQPEFQHPLVG